MRRQILGLSLLVIILTLTLSPTLFGYTPTGPAVVTAGPPLPGPTDLNATTPLVSNEPYTPANPNGNSSLLNVLVLLVNASDIGECRDGDLTVHKFRVHNNTNDALMFEDDLGYISGKGWTVENYSLLTAGLPIGYFYYVRCYFERYNGIETWTNTTKASIPFIYQYSITAAIPDYTYIGDTSDTIDVSIEHISSSVWGALNEANTTLIFQNVDNATDITQFQNILIYNVSSTNWEVDELNISVLIPGQSYKIRVGANYSLRYPFHEGLGGVSDAFTFRGPYLRVAQPQIIYVGRGIQALNITIDWVWHSIFGYLSDIDVDISNFSISLSTGTAGIVLNGTLNWNAAESNWYFAPFNVSFYVEQGDMLIGESYNVSAYFNSPARSGRPAVNNTSPFSDPFLIDFDPPTIEDVYLNPTAPTDDHWVVVTGDISDDALIDTVILSYYNGSQWINVTMSGRPSKQANFTAAIPPFPERAVIDYKLYVNDTQNAWDNITLQYTVADSPPVISFINYLPRNPTTNNPVTINATVIDGTGVSSVQLQYSYDGIIWLPPQDMTSVGNDVYQVVLPPYPQLLQSHEFRAVLFRISATDVYDNIRESANLAYQVQGTLPTLNPANTLLIIAFVGIAGVAIILLYKVYEQY
ncbi:MAG: hypothetical protein ACFFBR_04625 [Promethearchaeota archaeon]